MTKHLKDLLARVEKNGDAAFWDKTATPRRGCSCRSSRRSGMRPMPASLAATTSSPGGRSLKGKRMADLPIPFSPAMVRAILREIEQPGTGKTQTRRILKPQPPAECDIRYMLGNESWLPEADRTPLRHHWEAWSGPLFYQRPEGHLCGSFTAKMKYKPGDRLYVREHWRVSQRWDETAPRDLPARTMTVFFEAGGEIANQPSGRWEPAPSTYAVRPDWVGRFRHGMHMPRWASRLTLTVTDVRVQRLCDISEEDATAEGATMRLECTGCLSRDPGWSMDWSPVGRPSRWARDGAQLSERDIALNDPVSAFASFINELHDPKWNMKGDGIFGANPWVAAYSFTAELRNIDQGREAA